MHIERFPDLIAISSISDPAFLRREEHACEAAHTRDKCYFCPECVWFLPVCIPCILLALSLSKLVFPGTQAASVMYNAVTATSWEQFETMRKPLHVKTSSAGFSALEMCWPSERAPGTSAFKCTLGQHHGMHQCSGNALWVGSASIPGVITMCILWQMSMSATSSSFEPAGASK